jgi:hypothetical protein
VRRLCGKAYFWRRVSCSVSRSAMAIALIASCSAMSCGRTAAISSTVMPLKNPVSRIWLNSARSNAGGSATSVR